MFVDAMSAMPPGFVIPPRMPTGRHFPLPCILGTMTRSAGEARMSLSFRNVRRLSAGGLIVLSMYEPASAQLPPDGSQTRHAQAIERQEVRASASECSRTTPLPADTTITPPGADVPADVARFSGACGVWTGRTGTGGPCTTLVVEEVLANGYARVVYSIGVFDPHVRLPRYWRASGRIVNGVLSFGLLAPWRAEYTFRPAGTDLAGTYKEGTVESIVTAAPIADVRQVGCPPVPAGHRARHAIAF